MFRKILEQILQPFLLSNISPLVSLSSYSSEPRIINRITVLLLGHNCEQTWPVVLIGHLFVYLAQLQRNLPRGIMMHVLDLTPRLTNSYQHIRAWERDGRLDWSEMRGTSVYRAPNRLWRSDSAKWRRFRLQLDHTPGRLLCTWLWRRGGDSGKYNVWFLGCSI